MFIRINPRQRSVHDLVTRGTTPNTKMDDFLNKFIFFDVGDDEDP